MIDLDERVRPYMIMKAFITWLITVLVLSGLAAATYYYSWPVWFYYIIIGLIILDLAILVLLRPWIYTKVTSYKLLEDKIIVRQGFITVKTQMIPIKRAQGVEFKTGPLSRKYNLGLVSIKTAGLGIDLPPLKTEEARELKSDIMTIVKGEITDV